MKPLYTIKNVAIRLRQHMKDTESKIGKRIILIFAYNATGKTRLSMAFKDIGRRNDELNDKQHTLYFNAFTEDLFVWDNDFDGDSEYMLMLNRESRFFQGLEYLDIENRIRPFLNNRADFAFKIDTDKWAVRFSRQVPTGFSHDKGSLETQENIKISRGEENLFIWCFFLAIMQLAIDQHDDYAWVKYIYIDDPISSLDENNAVAVGHHLAKLLKENINPLKIIISTHHTLFFNVLCNEFKKQFKKNNESVKQYFLSNNKQTNSYTFTSTSETPFFYHVAMLAELHKAVDDDKLRTYHFNILRSILEKTASFHGYNSFADCIKRGDKDEGRIFHKRVIDIMNHGNYSLYEPKEMGQNNKELFKEVLDRFVEDYKFNKEIFHKALGIPEKGTTR